MFSITFSVIITVLAIIFGFCIAFAFLFVIFFIIYTTPYLWWLAGQQKRGKYLTLKNEGIISIIFHASELYFAVITGKHKKL